MTFYATIETVLREFRKTTKFIGLNANSALGIESGPSRTRSTGGKHEDEPLSLEEICYAIVLSNFIIVGPFENKCNVCALHIISYLLRDVMGL